MSFKIVSDSSSNIFEFPGIDYASAPLNLVFNERDHIDTPDLDVDALLDEMQKTKARVTSSCPNIGDWLRAYEGGKDIFVVTITGSLSGGYGTAVEASKVYIKENPDARIHVFDSLSTGPEMRLIIEKISELCQKELSFDAIVSEINGYMKKTHLIFCLSSLANLARAGRVSPAKAKIAGVLGIRVLGEASEEGTLRELHKIRGEDKALALMLKEMELRGYQGGKVRISHTHNAAAADKVCALIKEKFPESDVIIQKNAALCSYYAEEGGVLLGFEA